MAALDVKEIRDIPEIENYFDKTFKLSIYEVDDGREVYSLDIGDNLEINIDLFSDEKIIEGELLLVDIITRVNIHYLSYEVVLNKNDIIKQYCYRPRIPNNEKTVIK